MASRVGTVDTGIEKGFERYYLYQFLKFLLLWSLSNKRQYYLSIGMVQHKATVLRPANPPSVPNNQFSNFCVTSLGPSDWTIDKWLRHDASPFLPPFPRLQIITLTNSKLINTLFSTFTALKIAKCCKLSTITIALLTSQTLSTLTTLPLMMNLKYWLGCLHWSHGYGTETSEPSG